MNQGVDSTELGPQTTLVIYKIMTEVRSLILQSAENIVLTASISTGTSDLVKEPTSVEKNDHLFPHRNKTLGFITNSRSMTASYLDYKIASILYLLHSS